MGSGQAAPVGQRQQHTHHLSNVRDGEAHRYCIQCWVPVGGRPLCYPHPLATQSAATWQASKLSTCYLHTGTPPALLADVCVVDLSCVLLPSIRISLVASARYRRCSFSHDIIAMMCGWRSISRYRLIDIIPNTESFPRYLVTYIFPDISLQV